MKLKIRFPQPISHTITYRFNTMLSFGFIRSIAAKAGLCTGAVMLVASLLLSAAGLSVPLWSALIAGLAGGVSVSLLLRPIEGIRKELASIQ